jgi:hypothetical protein
MLDPTSASGHVGLKWAQIDPDGPQVEAMPRTGSFRSGPTWCNLEPFGGSFAPSWAQRRHNIGFVDAKRNVENTNENALFDDFVLGRLGPKLWSQVGPSWAQVRGRGLVGQLEPMLWTCGLEILKLDDVALTCKIGKRTWHP